MDLITQMVETQKIQEVRLDELKSNVEVLQEELEAARSERDRAESDLTEARNEIRNLEENLNRIVDDSKRSKERYVAEMSAAKENWNSIEVELKTTYETIVGELRRFEDKTVQLEDELKVKNEKLASSTRNEIVLVEEMDKLKHFAREKDENCSSLKIENEKSSAELHNVKLLLLKERNINDRLLDEVRRLRKEADAKSKQIENLSNEKESMSHKVAQLVQAACKERVLEVEFKELRNIMNVVVIGNQAIDEKMTSLRTFLKGDSATVGVQTTMTNSDLDQYEHLDRQATIMVMGLREQLVELKQQYLDSKQENETLKGFVHEVRREKEEKEESERVDRLEEAVKSLSDLVRQEMYEPSRESCILEALQDVKKDLSSLKLRSRQNKAPPPRESTTVTSTFPNQTFQPCRPVKLVTLRNFRP